MVSLTGIVFLAGIQQDAFLGPREGIVTRFADLVQDGIYIGLRVAGSRATGPKSGAAWVRAPPRRPTGSRPQRSCSTRRRIVGWSMAARLHTSLVLDALDMALETRRPRSVIHHSDQGCQYTSLAFGARCREAEIRLSTGSVGDCFDNAMGESIPATLECELIDRRRFSTKAEATMAAFTFIEAWYNPRRRHSGIA